MELLPEDAGAGLVVPHRLQVSGVGFGFVTVAGSFVTLLLS
jgi:hypothetical protein